MDLTTYLKNPKISQEKLAKKLGITQGAISHWITGRARIPAERVFQIEKATNKKVRRHELRPDIYPVKTKKQGE